MSIEFNSSWRNNLFLTLAIGFGILLFFYWLSPENENRVFSKKEAQNIEQLATNIYSGSVESKGNFSNLDLSVALTNLWVPSSMLRKTGYPVRTKWGTKIDVQPHTVLEFGDGFMVDFAQIPKEACTEIPKYLSKDRVYDLLINNFSVVLPSGIDMSLVDDACYRNESSSMVFVYHDELVPKTAIPRTAQ